jgi:Rieske Fe-S protein
MKRYILLIFLSVLFFKCSTENKHPVPDTPIYVEPMFIYDTEFNSLLNPYGVVFLKNYGYMGNGIVVVNVGNDVFKAYDATCCYEVKQGCVVKQDSNSMLLVKCNCCGSKYELTYGSVSSGPSTVPLKEYKTTFDGEYLRIYNK